MGAVATCQVQPLLSTCKGLEREDLEDHWGSNLICCSDNSSNTAFEQVSVAQECCVPAKFEKDLVSYVAQRQWGDKSTSQTFAPHVPRGRILAPFTQRAFEDFYVVGSKLGVGSFGDVHEALARPVDADGEPELESLAEEGALVNNGQQERRVAVKIFHLTGNSAAQPSQQQQQQQQQQPQQAPLSTAKLRNSDFKKAQSFEAERRMLASLEHPHIVRMLECFKESNNLCIVLELCRGGELYSRLVERSKENGSGGLDEPLTRVLYKQMLHAVSYLHAQHVVHRDVKTENFLLVGERGTPEHDIVKLCDFGTASRLSKAKPRSMENIGTLSYTAPEVYANKGAAVPADAWSLGVVLYVMVTGTNPFRAPGRKAAGASGAKADKEETVRRIRTGDFEQRRHAWQCVSRNCQDLVGRFLVLDESTRLTCHEALGHKWLADAQPESFLAPTAVSVGRRALGMHAPKIISLLLRMPRLAYAQRLALECFAMASIESDLTPQVPWREMFLVLDADQDGRLSFAELAVGLRTLAGGASVARHQLDEHLESSAQLVDLDNSGSIEWVEWLVIALLSTKCVAQAVQPISAAFRLLDAPAGEKPKNPLDTAVQDTISHVISRWNPKQSDVISPSERRNCTLSDLRGVLSSLEVYEML